MMAFPTKKRIILRSTAAAEILGVSTKTLNRWADANMVHALTRTVGGHRRFTRTELERFRATRLGEPRCPHCGRSLVGRGLAQIQSLPSVTARNEPSVVQSQSGKNPKWGTKERENGRSSKK